MRRGGVTLWLAALTPEVLQVVQQSALGDALGHERMFFTLHSAIAHYEQMHAHV
jgi:hypothetical protein